MKATTTFDALDREKYLSLETYRKNGIGVRTPVWFAVAQADAASPKLYIYTSADSGKAKRVRRTGVSRIAVCNARGVVSGPWMDVRTEIVSGEDFHRGMALIDRKYRPWKQILDLFARMSRGHGRIMLAIRPVLPGDVSGAAD